jgi:hypothetical protein
VAHIRPIKGEPNDTAPKAVWRAEQGVDFRQRLARGLPRRGMENLPPIPKWDRRHGLGAQCHRKPPQLLVFCWVDQLIELHIIVSLAICRWCPERERSAPATLPRRQSHQTSLFSQQTTPPPPPLLNHKVFLAS